MVLVHVFLLSQSLSIEGKQLLNDGELFFANRALLIVLLQIIDLGNALQYLEKSVLVVEHLVQPFFYVVF